MKETELEVCQNPYEVKVHTNTLVTSGRRAEIARLILAGHSKSEIYKQLKEEFGIEDMAILQNEWRHAMTYIYLNVEQTTDDIKKLSLARLEAIIDQLERDSGDLSKKDSIGLQIKAIDTINKTAGIYQPQTNVSVEGADNFTVNLGCPVETKPSDGSYKE